MVAASQTDPFPCAAGEGGGSRMGAAPSYRCRFETTVESSAGSGALNE